MMENKLVKDLRKIDWNSMFVIGQRIGCSNFILQFLNESLDKLSKSIENKEIIEAFGMNSQILYVFREEMTDIEKKRIEDISLNHTFKFIRYDSIAPVDLANLCKDKLFTHIILDDLKPFYSMKGFPHFLKVMNTLNKKIICGFQSTDSKIKKSQFLLNSDFIIYININTINAIYDVEVISNLDSPHIKKLNFYAIPFISL